MKSPYSTFYDFKEGQKGIIKALTQGDKAYRQKLLAMGVIPGVAFKVKRIAPLGDPIELELKGYSLSLRRSEASCVEVEKQDE